ncbi:hypothetical protein [Kaarinaea lacus]
MKSHKLWKICCFLTTLSLCANIVAAEDEEQRDSSAIEINVTEITAQCTELYADIAAEEEQNKLIENCIAEKMEKLKNFAGEQG